jgi:hypothetical protein
VPDSFFSFDTKKFPGVEVIDLRWKRMPVPGCQVPLNQFPGARLPVSRRDGLITVW